MYYKNLRINGVDYPIAVNITGNGAPTIEAEIGMLYMDIDNGEVYKFMPEGWKSINAECIEKINKQADVAGTN